MGSKEEQELSGMAEAARARTKYILKCNKCGKEFGYQHMCSKVKYADRFLHSGCGGGLTRVL